MKEAHALLASVYSRFTEGFATADLRNAGAGGSRGTEGERVAEWRERRQCRRVQYADRDQQPSVLRRQISQSDQRRCGRAKRQEDFRSIQTIRQPGNRLSSHQPHRRTSGQRQRDRLRTQVAIVEQNWQVRRLDAEPRIEQAVEERNRYNIEREELIIDLAGRDPVAPPARGGGPLGPRVYLQSFNHHRTACATAKLAR